MLHEKSVRFAPDTRFDGRENRSVTTDLDIEDNGKGNRSGSPYLIEIISAADLINLKNSTGSNIYPYVSIFYGKHCVHSTKKTTAMNNLDPIWTVESQSLFLFDPNDFQEDFLSADEESHGIERPWLLQNDNDQHEEQLVFVVMNTSKGIKNTSHVIGQASILLSNLLETEEGKRIELRLVQTKNPTRRQINNSTGNTHGKEEGDHSMSLSIRYRKATENDIQFISDSKASSKSSSKSVSHDTLISRHHTSMITPIINVSSFARRKKNLNGKTYFLALPPKPDATSSLDQNEQWLTQEELDKVIWEPSTSWTVCYGKGSLGKLYVEVIECNDLLYRHKQRTRKSTVAEKKVDPFITIIHEDSIVSSDALPDCKNPRFLPWSRRAFKFHVEHSYSPIYIGVYDYEESRLNLGGLKKKMTRNQKVKNSNGKRKFEEIGRAAISIQKLKSNVEYNMVYDLYRSGETSHQRIKQGSITLRICLRWYNERRVFFDIMNPHPTQFVVNVPTKVDYSDANYAINGLVDMTQYDTNYIYEMVDELIEYHHYIHVLKDFLKTLYFWRAKNKISLGCCELKLPLNSLIIFSFANIIIEWPQYSVCIFFATITWIMLTLLDFQRQFPSAWSKPPSYLELLLRLLLGISWPSTIPKDQNKVYHDRRQESWNEFLRRNDQETRKLYNDIVQRKEDDEHMTREFNQVLNKKEIKSRYKLENIWKGVLHPLQLNMRELCLFVRYIDQIIRWEQLYICFWITTISLMLTIIFAILIWKYDAWLWFQRIVLWGLFGPCNCLVDILYYRKVEKMSLDHRHRLAERNKPGNRKMQTMREDKIKAAAMRKFMFGHYGLEVPDTLRRPERYTSVPQISSSCSPCSIRQIDEIIERSRFTENLIGQHNGISGEMIPVNYTDHSRNDIRKYNSFVSSGIIEEDLDSVDSEATPLLSS